MTNVGSAACPECGLDWGTSERDITEAVRAAGASYERLRLTAAPLDGQRWLRRPCPSVWSAIEYIAHTADAVDWYHSRIARALSEHRPVLDAPFDWDALCEDRRYRDRALTEAFDELGRSSSDLARRLESLGTGSWSRTGIGSDGVERSVAALALRALHELRHHRVDVERSLE